VGKRTPCTHFGRHPNGFHNLAVGRTSVKRTLGVPLDAVRALRDVRNCNGDQLLSFLVNLAIGKNGCTKGLEGVRGLWRQIVTLSCKIATRRRVHGIVHQSAP
jgi:hypothetical protein